MVDVGDDTEVADLGHNGVVFIGYLDIIPRTRASYGKEGKNQETLRSINNSILDFMQNILNSIKESLKNKNWYAALISSLILPDICSKLEGSNEKSQSRYTKWLDKHLDKKYDGFLSSNDCYALRCAFLHEGSPNIENQRARDVLDHFVFVGEGGAHCSWFSNCVFGNKKFDNTELLQLSVNKFCQDMIGATEKWLVDIKDDVLTQRNITEMLEIHEKDRFFLK